ncbi:MAG: cell wall protein, partial [Pelagibacteraceae bacterium]|nr:cell wall protein [Pelagibacteraceae bacterium]
QAEAPKQEAKPEEKPQAEAPKQEAKPEEKPQADNKPADNQEKKE